MQLDEIDLKLLFYLQGDSRMKMTSLARKLDLTSGAVKYRIERLIQSGIISKFTIMLNRELLTPSFQSYFISMQVYPKNIEEISIILQKTKLFERLIQTASTDNLQGITIPLASEDLKMIIKQISRRSVNNYSVTPIINDSIDHAPVLYSDTLSSFRCPSCNDEVSGKAFIGSANGHEYTFCCVSCMEQFSVKLASLSE